MNRRVFYCSGLIFLKTNALPVARESFRGGTLNRVCGVLCTRSTPLVVRTARRSARCRSTSVLVCRWNFTWGTAYSEVNAEKADLHSKGRVRHESAERGRSPSPKPSAMMRTRILVGIQREACALGITISSPRRKGGWRFIFA